MSLYTIYLVSAVAGGTILVLRFLLMLFGLGADAHMDMPIDVDHGDVSEGFNFLSIQSIAGFFTMFGLVGLGLLQVEAGTLWSVVGALAAGAVTAWFTGMIFMLMRRLQSEGNLDIRNAIGQQGSVYLTIPENGTGVITVTVQGGQRQMDAISQTGRRIPTGKLVKVTGITAGNILMVAALDEHENLQAGPVESRPQAPGNS